MGGKEEAYVTLATSDFYAPGCIVLGHSLRRHETTRKLVALLTDDVSWSMSELLQQVFDIVERIPKIDSEHGGSSANFLPTLTKLYLWKLTQFTKCVFISNDALVLQNCDELFDWPELSAAPDINWPDSFNSAVFVYEPSLDTFRNLMEIAKNAGRFEGGDEWALKRYFSPRWQKDLQRRLPFLYNVACSSVYSYVPALHHYGSNARIVQFVGQPKPWTVPWNRQSDHLQPLTPLNADFQIFYEKWLDVFKEDVYPKLPERARDWSETHNVARVFDIMSNLKTVAEPELPGDARPVYEGTVQGSEPKPPSRIHEDFRLPDLNFQCPTVSPIPFDMALRAMMQVPAPVFEETEAPVSELCTCAIRKPETVKQSFSVSASGRGIHTAPSETAETVRASTSAPVEVTLGSQRISASPSPTLGSQHESKKQDATTPDVSATSQRPLLDFSVASPPTSVKSLHAAALPATSTSAEKDEDRMLQWEKGNIDYLGKDNFDNIWKRLSTVIDQPGSSAPQEGKADDASTSDQSSLSEFDIFATKSDPLGRGDERSISNSNSSNSIAEDFYRDGAGFAATGRLPGYAIGDYEHMHEWEQGRMDYCGRDCSDNIMRRLDFLISNEDYLSTK